MGDQDVNFRFLAENSADIICRTAPDTRLLYVSPSSLRLLGWKPEEMTGRHAVEFILPEDLPSVKRSIEECNAPGVDGVTATIRFIRKNGTTVWMEVNARAVRDAGTDDPTEHVIIMRDITDRKLLEDKLASLASTDGLTGLANRRTFDEALAREWRATLRKGSQISLLLLDIDHFKQFNDRYGHQFGDDCLRAVAAAASASVRGTDTVARYGGEEIAVILPACDSSTAAVIAERMRAAIEALRLVHREADETVASVTASIGAATALARPGGTIRQPESLVLAADNALYRAKEHGRNQIVTAMVMAPADEAAGQNAGHELEG